MENWPELERHGEQSRSPSFTFSARWSSSPSSSSLSGLLDWGDGTPLSDAAACSGGECVFLGGYISDTTFTYLYFVKYVFKSFSALCFTQGLRSACNTVCGQHTSIF